jgi:benzoyl-CoA reductase/2-hydroxyglutaryl-CoA dehydratase subunit BcrC/BadD/HgdB
MVELWDPPAAEDGHAAAHFPPMTCGAVRQGFDRMAAGGSMESDLLLFPHTCDSLQNMGTLMRDLTGEPRPCLFFCAPTGRTDGTAEAFLRAQIETLDADLDRWVGLAPPGAMERALEWGRRRAQWLSALYDRRAAGGWDLSNRRFYDAVRSFERLWPEEAIARLETLLSEPVGDASGHLPLVFSGVVPAPADLLDRLDALGVRVAEDDFMACGRRVRRNGVYGRGETPVEEGGDPYRTLARRLLAAPPCSTVGSPIEARLAFIESLVARSKSKGVVFLSLKFCEPDLFDAPPLVEGLKARGIPVLSVDVELGPATPAGLVTRIEAFLESLP